MATVTIDPVTSATNYLSGKKTYIASAISILTAVLAYLNGKESLSTALTNTPGLMLYVGGVAAALRSALKTERAKVETAVSKVEAKLPAPVEKEVEAETAKVEAEADKVA